MGLMMRRRCPQFETTGHSQMNDKVEAVVEVQDNEFATTPDHSDALVSDSSAEPLRLGSGNGSRPINMGASDVSPFNLC